MPTKTYAYAQYDGNKPIAAVVHYEDVPGTKSIALAIHGGGFSIGSKEMIPQAQINYLLNHNFVVVSIDYRLCPNISFLEGPIADTRTAYRWTLEKLPALVRADLSVLVDPAKVVVFGYSAGGHLAMMLGHSKPPPRAILNFYGPLNLRDRFWSDPIGLFPVLPNVTDDFINQVYQQPVLTTSYRSVEEAEAEIAKTTKRMRDEIEVPKASDANPADQKPSFGEDDPREAWLMNRLATGRLVPELVAGDPDAHDPIVGVTKDFPPTFFAHGDADILVDVDVSARYGKRVLDDLGVETGIAVVAGGPHGYDVPLSEGDDGWRDGVQDGLDFLIKHV